MEASVPAGPPPFRVLVCDDQEALRTAVAKVLSNTPLFQVVAEAADGPGCIEQVHQVRPHLLILDVNVPGGGPHVPRAVKDIAPDLYILVYTSHRDPEIEDQMLAAGADEYLVKTGRLAPLIHALNTAATRSLWPGQGSPDVAPGEDLPKPSKYGEYGDAPR